MARGTTDRTSLWRLPAMRALVGATSLGFVSYCLTLASLPAYAVAGGASPDTAGVVTAVFLVVTIAVQSVVPALTARFGLGPVLAAGLVALGAPSPLYAVDDGVVWLSGVSAVRGAGFAVLTVLGAVLAAQVAPAERRGESIGLYGLAIAVPNLLAVPAGAALVLDGHPGWLAWLAASPVLALPLVPGLARSVHWQAGAGSSSSAAVRAALAPSAVLLLVTLAGGGLVTFLPIERPDGVLATAALLVFGLTGAVTRWRAGLLADRLGGRGLLVASVGVGVAGMLLLAAGMALMSLVRADGEFVVDVLPASLIAAAAMALAFIPSLGTAISSAPPQDGGLASGIVNTTYQVGSALGLAVMTAVATSQGADRLGDAGALTDGYSAAFTGAAAIAVVAALLAGAFLRRPADADATRSATPDELPAAA